MTPPHRQQKTSPATVQPSPRPSVRRQRVLLTDRLVCFGGEVPGADSGAGATAGRWRRLTEL